MRRPAPLGAIAAVIVLGSMMTVLDTTIVHVALGRLAETFGASLSSLQWVVTGYTLALAAVIPVTAWAIGRVGTKRLYITAVGLFTAGSALAGLAWSTGSLITFRVLQGLGGGMVMPVAMTIMIRAAGGARMGRVMSLMGLPVLIGPVLGPVVGGWLVDEVSWRWIFLINVPIGLVTATLAARWFPRDEPEPVARLDVPGLLALSPGLALLIWGLATGGERNDFADPAALLPALAGAALITAFVVRALRIPHPLLDLRLFRGRTLAVGVGALGLFATAYFGSMMLLPLYYQLARGQGATEAGLLGIPQGVVTGLTMQVAGRLVDRVPPRRVVLTGIPLAALGFAAFTTQVGDGTPYWRLIVPLMVMGAGVGATMMPLMTTVQRGVRREDVPVVSTLLAIVPQIGSSIGAALVSVVLASGMQARLPAGTDSLNAVQAAPDAVLHAVAPALADAFQHTYLWPVALMALALVPALWLPRGAPAPPAASPAPERDRVPAA